MDVILLEKVENLGGIGDRVKVRSGYGRNFLLPKGKAKLATPENVQALEAMRAELEAKAAADLATAPAQPQTVADAVVPATAAPSIDRSSEKITPSKPSFSRKIVCNQ